MKHILLFHSFLNFLTAFILHNIYKFNIVKLPFPADCLILLFFFLFSFKFFFEWQKRQTDITNGWLWPQAILQYMTMTRMGNVNVNVKRNHKTENNKNEVSKEKTWMNFQLFWRATQKSLKKKSENNNNEWWSAVDRQKWPDDRSKKKNAEKGKKRAKILLLSAKEPRLRKSQKQRACYLQEYPKKMKNEERRMKDMANNRTIDGWMDG